MRKPGTRVIDESNAPHPIGALVPGVAVSSAAALLLALASRLSLERPAFAAATVVLVITTIGGGYAFGRQEYTWPVAVFVPPIFSMVGMALSPWVAGVLFVPVPDDPEAAPRYGYFDGLLYIPFAYGLGSLCAAFGRPFGVLRTVTLRESRQSR